MYGVSLIGISSSAGVSNAVPTGADIKKILIFMSSMDMSSDSAIGLIHEFIKVDYSSLSESDKKKFDSIRVAVVNHAENNKLSSIDRHQNMDKQKQYDSISGLLWNLIYGSTRWVTDIATMTLDYLGMDYLGFVSMLRSISNEVNFDVDVMNSSDNAATFGISRNVEHGVNERISVDGVRNVLSLVDVSNISVEDIVKKLYNVLFLREADESGLNFWVNEIRKGITNGQSVESVVEGVVVEMLGGSEAKNVK